MKYRIVKYSDNSFGVQKKILFWWFNKTIECDAMSFTLTFSTIKEAETYVEKIKSLYTNYKSEIIKEL